MTRSKSTILIAAFLFVELLGGAVMTSTASPRLGRIKGIVLDVNKARVVNAVVIVQGGEVKRQVMSNFEGRFEVSLPPGSYQITVKADGFRQFTSPLLRIESGKNRAFDVHLIVETPRGLVPALVQP
jgi:sporulation protein YlmC with PRC-barrel domain